MKPSLILAFTLSSILARPPDAAAQGNPAGRYQLDIELTSDSCETGPVALAARSELVVTMKGDDLIFKLSAVPEMRGPQKTRGKFRVEGKDASPRSGGTIGTFAATGRFDPNEVRMILIAEHVKDGKTQCSQSWNITGKR